MKKKILAIVLCVAMLAIAVVGGTMAYFTDTHQQTNTFTAGKVNITLDEKELAKDDDGNLLFDEDGELTYTNNRTETNQTYKLFPAMEVTKDPTITLSSESEDAYLAAIVTVKIPNSDLTVMRNEKMQLIHPDSHAMLMVGALLKGGVVDTAVTLNVNHPLYGLNGMAVYTNDDYSVYQIPDPNNETWTIYMFFEGAKSASASVTLFDTIIVPDTWDNAEMATVNDMTIDVAAYAVQANGFDNCYDAMIGAFPTVFPQKPANP